MGHTLIYLDLFDIHLLMSYASGVHLFLLQIRLLHMYSTWLYALECTPNARSPCRMVKFVVKLGYKQECHLQNCCYRDVKLKQMTGFLATLSIWNCSILKIGVPYRYHCVALISLSIFCLFSFIANPHAHTAPLPLWLATLNEG